jgi:putative OPT family oligopeptide transporter
LLELLMAAEVPLHPPEPVADAPKTPDEIERHWFEHVYQGDDMPQTTVRSVVMGSLLGCLMSLSNLYVGLKTGWGMGVSITACILSYTIWTTLRKVGIAKTDMSILENNSMQSTATAAGVSTGGTMVSAIAAYLMMTNHHMSGLVLTLWTFFLAVLGVMMAIPMKRQMINVEQLRFPSGVATATTLKSLHAKGDEAKKQANALFASGALGAVMALLRDAFGKIPATFNIPGLTIAGQPGLSYTIGLEGSLLLMAAGGIMGFKAGWSLLLGALVNYGYLAPHMHAAGVIKELTFRSIVSWSLWPGAALMVTAALTSFAFQWKAIARSFTSLGKVAQGHEPNPMDRIEVPNSWFAIGTGISSLACVAILITVFHTSWWMSLLSIVMAFVLSLVACRVTGETDTTPIGAMGKMTQLTYGILAPGQAVINLMTAGVTAGAAGAAADLLTDLKSGYVLGANPRKQFIAQFAGVFAGTAIVVPAFYLLVPTASVLGSDAFPAPAAQVWYGVAKLMSNGLESLHPTAQAGLLYGGLTGIVIAVVDRLAPAKLKPFIPSPMGLGLAFVIPAFNSISMFIGALIALIFAYYKPKAAETYTIPVSSGIVAGESLMGVGIALASAAGIIK